MTVCKFIIVVLVTLTSVKDVMNHNPLQVKSLLVTNTSIEIQWTDKNPEKDEENHQFKVVAIPIDSHDAIFLMEDKRDWIFDGKYRKGILMALKPGTKYNITVWKQTSEVYENPVSEIIWTDIGIPETPPPVEILEKGSTFWNISLKKAKNRFGPISKYQIIVVGKPDIVVFTPEQLYDYEKAKEEDVLYYVAAELSPSTLKKLKIFNVGDGKQYGRYYNAPLVGNGKYAIIMGVVSTFNNVTKKSFSKMAGYEFTNYSEDGSEVTEDKSSDSLLPALTTSIGILVALILIAIVLYVVLRRFYRPNTRRLSQQQLAVSNPAFEGTNGDCSSDIYLDDVNVGVSRSQSIEQIWDIPTHVLQVHKHIVGYGKFGQVHSGSVNKNHQKMEVIVVTTQVPSLLTSEERRNLTYEVEAMNRISHHDNIISLVGKAEIDGLLHIVIEHTQETALSALHNSRCHELSHSSSNKTISTFSSNQLLQLMLAVVSGINHLHQNRIIHQLIMARNILMIGAVPKVANFSLSFFETDGKHSQQRWSAVECFQNRCHNIKSDVWSLGMLMWEVATLGGTPYHLSNNKEVARKVIQGTRLPKPSYVSHELFQLMLDCWQTDPDERPSLTTIIQNLQLYIHDDRDHINLKFHPGFQYHKYDPSC